MQKTRRVACLLLTLIFLGVLTSFATTRAMANLMVISQNDFYNNTIEGKALNIVGEIQNTGNSVAKFPEVQISCYDINHNLIKSQDIYTILNFLNPNGKSPFTTQIFGVDNMETYNLSVNWAETATIRDAALKIISSDSHIDSSFYYVDGTIMNTGNTTATGIHLALTFYDNSGNIFDVGSAVADNIGAGQTGTFESILVSFSPGGISSIASYSIAVESDQYESLTYQTVATTRTPSPIPPTTSSWSTSPIPTQWSQAPTPYSSQASDAFTANLTIAALVVVVLVITVVATAILLLKRRNKSKPPIETEKESKQPEIQMPRRSTHHDVFISYSNRDKKFADAACNTLETKKIRCWMAPRDIMPGQNFAQAILEAIDQSQVFVLIFSEVTNSSEYIIREVQSAVNRGIPIITFRIEDIKPTNAMAFYLSTPHWLDAMTPPLEKHLLKLAETVQLLLSNKKT